MNVIIDLSKTNQEIANSFFSHIKKLYESIKDVEVRVNLGFYAQINEGLTKKVKDWEAGTIDGRLSPWPCKTYFFMIMARIFKSFLQSKDELVKYEDIMKKMCIISESESFKLDSKEYTPFPFPTRAEEGEGQVDMENFTGYITASSSPNSPGKFWFCFADFVIPVYNFLRNTKMGSNHSDSKYFRELAPLASKKNEDGKYIVEPIKNLGEGFKPEYTDRLYEEFLPSRFMDTETSKIGGRRRRRRRTKRRKSRKKRKSKRRKSRRRRRKTKRRKRRR